MIANWTLEFHWLETVANHSTAIELISFFYEVTRTMGRPPSSRSASFSLTAIVQCNRRYEYRLQAILRLWRFQHWLFSKWGTYSSVGRKDIFERARKISYRLFSSAMSLPLALLRIENSSFLLHYPKILTKTSIPFIFNYPRTPKEFLKNSSIIPQEFLKNSSRISKKIPKNSNRIARVSKEFR